VHLLGSADQIEDREANNNAGKQLTEHQAGSQLLENRRNGSSRDQKDQLFAKK
jgi:hypothetical protein